MSSYKVTIQRHEVKTTIVSTPVALESALQDLLSSLNKDKYVKRLVGLDTEQSNNEIDILKLATGTTCLLIQLHQFDCQSFPLALSKFLQLPDISFVGVGIKFSLEALERVYKIRCRNAFDLGSLAAEVKENKGLQACGLVDLADTHCLLLSNFLVKSPDVAFSDWSATALSDEQIRCATTDAYLAFLIGNNLLGGSMPSVDTPSPSFAYYDY